MNTQSSTSISTSFYCKHHLPCGYCELKKEQCTWFSYTLPKEYFEPKWNEPVSVYGCPTWTDVTCTEERSEDVQKPD